MSTLNPSDASQLKQVLGEEAFARLAQQAIPDIPAPVRKNQAAFDTAVAALIDHTALKPETTAADVRRLCQEALLYRFASVCVNPCWVPLAAEQTAGSTVIVCTVVGFPLGASQTEIKRAEAETALRGGAGEIDMVMNVGALRSGDLETVRRDIFQVAEACRAAGAKLKVILETALLTDDEKTAACVLSKLAGASYVKTSTGFGPGGATEHDVALMRGVVGQELGVKASGGVRTLEDLRRMAAAGANRIGTSASVAIIEATAA